MPTRSRQHSLAAFSRCSQICDAPLRHRPEAQLRRHVRGVTIEHTKTSSSGSYAPQESLYLTNMAKVIYNFLDGAGDPIDGLQGLELGACPRKGEAVIFALDGQTEGRPFEVQGIWHKVCGTAPDRVKQIVEVYLEPILQD